MAYFGRVPVVGYPGQDVPLVPLYATTDGYEAWYSTKIPIWNNRMVLSLRSGIQDEIEWALDRIIRLLPTDPTMLKRMPGLLDALYEWPHVFLDEYAKEIDDFMFAPPPEEVRLRRNGLLSIFILRSMSLTDSNIVDLARHPGTVNLIYKTFITLNPDNDSHAEFLLSAIELLQNVGYHLYFPKAAALASILSRLETIVCSSNNRSLILNSLGALTSLMQNMRNLHHFDPASPALDAAIRYVLLFTDEPLTSAALEYLYIRLSHPPMLRAFLLHHDLTNTLRVLVTLILKYQKDLEEDVVLDIQFRTPLDLTHSAKNGNGDLYEMTPEEVNKLVDVAEPQRSYEWLKTMFTSKTAGEVTQVDFWNMYKEIFTPFADRRPLLVAADVIKNVTAVFPYAQAMVIPGPPQRFVIRGIVRRRIEPSPERFQCLWNQSKCPTEPFSGPQDLYDHILQHLAETPASMEPMELEELPLESAESTERLTGKCEWGSCDHIADSVANLQGHLLTHVPSLRPASKHPSQPDKLIYEYDAQNPIVPNDPPRLRGAKVRYRRPATDPKTASLTALLIIRLVFRISSSVTDSVPRADEDHFGFPGIQEEVEEEQNASVDAEILAGERKGRAAIQQVRHLMEEVRIKDSTLQNWITEMINAYPVGDPNT